MLQSELQRHTLPTARPQLSLSELLKCAAKMFSDTVTSQYSLGSTDGLPV